MASTINENEDFAGGQFTPFQDSDTPRVQSAVQNFVSATQGYDTTVFDQYRQGVSMRTSRHLYATTQPKIWAGNLSHAVRVVTIGQARDFTEFEDDPKFEELPEFTPDWYIEDENYPFPIVFNNGPQQEEEAIIEPFTIPFRKANPFGNFVPRTPKGNLEDGNNFDNYDGGTTRVLQFIEYNAPSVPRFFLDEGVEYYGPPIPTASLLDTSLNPLAVYNFNGNIADSSGNSFDLSLASGSVTYTDGPVGGTQALFLTPTTALTSAVESALHLTGAMTIQAVIRPASASLGSGRVFAAMQGPFGAAEPEENNILYYLGTSADRMTDLTWLLQSGSSPVAGIKFATATNVLELNSWFHVAYTRDDSNNHNLYVNGTLVSSVTESYPTTGSSPGAQRLVVGTLWLTAGFSFGNAYSGSLSSLKIHGEALSADALFNEYAQVFPREAGAIEAAYRNSINIDGYVAFIQRDMDPFDDTRDEQIVEQINTTDATFIGRLKELDFDLSEDIRGTFDRKSATAGGDVYGPDAARYGTDSIAYRGLIRGS